MSKEQLTPQRDLEPDKWVAFAKKVEEKKKKLGEAAAVYNSLCSEVDKQKQQLALMKMERFKVDFQIQETEIRVRVLENREKELRSKFEKMKTDLNDAESALAQEVRVRDRSGEEFVRKVIHMADEYCSFQQSCDRKQMSESYKQIMHDDATLSTEIKEFLSNAGLPPVEENNWDDATLSLPPLQLVANNEVDEQTILNLRHLQSFIQKELFQWEESQIQMRIQIDQNNAKKLVLQQELEKLKQRATL